MDDFMRKAIEESRINLSSGQGGPFGAIIVRGDTVIAQAHNRVLETNDPTMHAEIAAIRIAAQKLGTFDLSGCELYTSCEPCPMCLSAMMWAKIKRYYYANTRSDAAEIGFDDKAIYDYLAGDLTAIAIESNQCCHAEALEVFTAWTGEKRDMY